MTNLAPVLQGFFTDRLARQKKASPNTIAAYRDTCWLLSHRGTGTPIYTVLYIEHWRYRQAVPTVG
jgi:hypothetical protein